MKKIFLLISLLAFSFTISAQSIIDTIITNKFDTISCQITYVNNYSIFYKYQKGKKLKEKIIPRIDVSNFIVHNKNVTVMDKKLDSGINEYYMKSKLNKKYDVLLLTNNSESTLKILADSTFEFKKHDYFLIATIIQNFARQYRCKLIYLSEIKSSGNYSVNVKLYDATDNYYKEVLKTYEKEEVYFLRTNNSFEPKENTIKVDDTKIVLNKNEYYVYRLSELDNATRYKRHSVFELENNLINDSLKNNQYFYVGNPSQYKNAANYAVGALGGAIVVTATIGRKPNYLSNFVGEFMRINIDNLKP